MELSVFTKAVYVYVAYRLYGKNMDFRHVNGTKGKQAIAEFSQVMLDNYGAAAGPFFIWFYTVFQFSRFELRNFRPEGAINFCTPTMIYGKGAIDKFGFRKTIDELTMQSPWLQEHKISMQDFVKEKGYTFTADMAKIDRSKVEKIKATIRNPIKQVTSTTNEGMDLCYDLTDLYNPQDPSCQSCPYAEECKGTLKKERPEIYKLRNI